MDESIEHKTAVRKVGARTTDRTDTVIEVAGKDDQAVIFGHHFRKASRCIVAGLGIRIKQEQFAAQIGSWSLVEEVHPVKH
jgi:hypothetical protein